MSWWRKEIQDPDWLSRVQVGKWGEEKAAEYLRGKGYKIIARHWTHRIGELDIVASKGERIIFVEVKTRTNNRFGTPEESIGYYKQQKLARTANVYMLKYQLNNVPYQIDSVAVMYDFVHKEATIRHMENVVSGR